MNDLFVISRSARQGARQRWAQLALATVLALGAGSALAQLSPAPAAPGRAKSETPASSVSAELTQAKVFSGPDGKEQMLDAASVKPGDVIEYRAVYTNRTTKPVVGVVATLPIPEGLEYLPKSAKPAGAMLQAATKEGIYGSEPLTRKTDGKTEPVPYADYRTLRWTLGQLPAGGVSTVSLRATVQVFVPPAPVAGASALPQAPPVAAQKTPVVAKP